jgi:hypothetical protein
MKFRGLFLGALAALMSAGPAHAILVTKVEIQNANNTWLQVAELEAFEFITGINKALTGVASATSVYSSAAGPLPGGVAVAANANDGIRNQSYYATPGIYHGDNASGLDVLTIAFGALPFDLQSLSIFGRTDCCLGRDRYTYRLFNGASQVATGTLDANNQAGSASTSFLSAVPEPTTWAMFILGFGIVGLGLRRRVSMAPQFS